MKLFLSITILSLLTVACGPTKNNPLENYRHLNLSKEEQATSQKVDYRLVTQIQDKVVYKDKIVYVDRPVVVTNEKVIYVRNCPPELNETDKAECLKNLESTGKELFIDSIPFEVRTYSDSTLKKEEAMIFTEGQESTYYISAQIRSETKVNFDLTIEDTPVKATTQILESTKQNSVTYKITWKPENVIKAGQEEDKALIKVSLVNIDPVTSDLKIKEMMKLTFAEISNTVEKSIIVKSADSSSASAPTKSIDPTSVEGRR